jgi:hypothetical protein
VIEAGMWDHIAKPLNVGEMFATLAKWIKPGNAEGAAGGTATAPAIQGKTLGGLPVLAGIDVKAGMATTMNNEKLYTRMLKFRDSQVSLPSCSRPHRCRCLGPNARAYAERHRRQHRRQGVQAAPRARTSMQEGKAAGESTRCWRRRSPSLRPSSPLQAWALARLRPRSDVPAISEPN